MTIQEKIEKIPGDEGWWKNDSQDTFEEVAHDLLKHGFTEDETIETLQALYWAVENCFS